MIRNIFFDFDGVIADSVNVKTEAFKQIYLPYGQDIANKVINHHKNNGGMSRFQKIKLYHQEYLDIELNAGGVEDLSQKFSKLVIDGVINSPEVLGSHGFVREFKDTFNMYVITGTPTEESKYICKRRGIFDCFKGIYGSPPPKEYWCNIILNRENLKPEETIFVGDALADYNAAIEFDLDFYLREHFENVELFEEIENITRFSNFNDFRKKIQLR